MKLRTALTALLLVLVVIFVGSFSATAQSTVKNYFSGCQAVNCDNVMHVGGTLAVASTATVTGLVSAPSNATYKVARGETALDGSNPTPVTTGLTTITGCALSIKSTAAPGVSTSVITYGSSSGTMNMYGWKPTSNADPTMIASAGTDTVGWVCLGT
jgi:hypothetical protein